MLSKIFIARPIFAWVIAIGVMMAGIAGITQLPIAQYPDIAPPSVNISATYPGASAATLESSVTQVIEQQLTGLDGLLYFSSTSSASGSVTITVTFDKGTDPDTAQVQVQNKVQQANSRLPSEVQQEGVTVTKSNSDFLLIVGLYDKTNKASNSDIADWLVNNLQDEISRINGVGSTQLFGSGYAIRIWLDPYKLAAVHLMPSDVSTAVEAQNADVSAGQIGQLPAVKGQELNAIVNAQSRLQTPRTVPQHHRQDRDRRFGRQAERCRAGRDGRRQLCVELRVQRASGVGPRAPARPRRGRAQDRHRGEGARRRTDHQPAPRLCRRLSARHDRLHQAVGQGGHQDADRGGDPRRHRHVHLPPGLARHAGARDRGAGGAARHLRGARAVRLFDQHADAVRHGAGDRASGRRCDRRRRECRAHHGGGKPLPARGDRQIDGGDRLGAGRHRTCAVRGAVADGVLRRLDGGHLPPVLDHDRHRDGAVGDGRADPHAGAVRDAAPPEDARQG